MPAALCILPAPALAAAVAEPTASVAVAAAAQPLAGAAQEPLASAALATAVPADHNNFLLQQQHEPRLVDWWRRPAIVCIHRERRRRDGIL